MLDFSCTKVVFHVELHNLKIDIQIWFLPFPFKIRIIYEILNMFVQHVIMALFKNMFKTKNSLLKD